jgi:hypothetical protein
MSSTIKIVCFDINTGIKKDLKENEIDLENPIRILDEFKENHEFIESKKTQKISSEIKYSFHIKLEKIIIIYEIFVLKDLSFIHDISLVSDANLIFINLENENTSKQLGKIVNYINESSCNMDIKVYIVGIYKDKIIPLLNKESIELFFDDQKLNSEMFQVKYNKNDCINHICMYENKEMKKNQKKNINKKNKNDNLNDIVEKILIEIFEIKMNVVYEPKKRSFRKRSIQDDEGRSISGSNCYII